MPCAAAQPVDRGLSGAPREGLGGAALPGPAALFRRWVRLLQLCGTAIFFALGAATGLLQRDYADLRSTRHCKRSGLKHKVPVGLRQYFSVSSRPLCRPPAIVPRPAATRR